MAVVVGLVLFFACLLVVQTSGVGAMFGGLGCGGCAPMGCGGGPPPMPCPPPLPPPPPLMPLPSMGCCPPPRCPPPPMHRHHPYPPMPYPPPPPPPMPSPGGGYQTGPMPLPPPPPPQPYRVGGPPEGGGGGGYAAPPEGPPLPPPPPYPSSSYAAGGPPQSIGYQHGYQPTFPNKGPYLTGPPPSPPPMPLVPPPGAGPYYSVFPPYYRKHLSEAAGGAASYRRGPPPLPYDPFAVGPGGDGPEPPNFPPPPTSALSDATKNESASERSEPSETTTTPEPTTTTTKARHAVGNASSPLAASDDPSESTPAEISRLRTRIRHPMAFSLPLESASSNAKAFMKGRRVFGLRGCPATVAAAGTLIANNTTTRPFSPAPLNSGCVGKSCWPRAGISTKVIKPEAGDGERKSKAASALPECSNTALRLIMSKYASMSSSDAKVAIHHEAERQLNDGAYQVVCSGSNLDFVIRASVFCTMAVADGVCYAFRSNFY